VAEKLDKYWPQSHREHRGGRVFLDIDLITGKIVDSAFSIHKGPGPGLLESVYEVVLYKKLVEAGLKTERQKYIDFEYDGEFFKEGFRVDLLVEDRVIVELKSVEQLAAVHSKQLLTYLRLMKLEVGLLINSGDSLFKNGVKRIVNNYKPSASPRLCVNMSD